MSDTPNEQEFAFDAHFNSQYINELYDSDYALIEETFADVLHEYGPLLQEVMVCYRSGDIPALRSAVHKIKPLLGYVGLTTLQAGCQQFENNCQQDGFPSLHEDFTALSAGLTTAKSQIEAEKARLTNFVLRSM
ncbi:Hpt domain-containing protein [Flavitalea sp. BT771]|uniref:Hpt domain-containing protein n=1 Tax=Flavitalea sp. BT771 TaxID=3063329 RepID=UPI0026E1B6C3|nr:Hpt domain-containing protein [Flavitalea sp. BT771]MDO6434177.1 Hpt domain-containing protein [Flavitalea sp. BT771]MDV6223077.1 Hpt domain-containing protein [Flavitalea sp. BT771]